MALDKPTILFAAVLIAVFPVWVLAATLNVPGDFTSIQACIDAAQDGDECVVAPETYHELIDFLGKAITVRSSGGPEVTIIDAGPIADPGTGKPVVRCDTGEGSDTVLEGFTLTGGTGDVSAFPGSYIGGGMFNLASSPTVINCTFIQNSADTGGGMYNSGLGDDEGSNPTVTNCTFIENNSVNDGGGMFNRGSNSSLRLTNCTFRGNTADSGGGMFNTGASLTLTDCTFDGNSGGGMFNISGSSPTVINCMFVGNESSTCGGGMCNYRSSPTVLNCTFIGNASGVVGGGMANESSSNSTVTNCRFMMNTAQAWGGGILNNGGSQTVTNCTFVGNTAAVGGGMYNSGLQRVTNCTISGNTAYIVGGGMHNHNSGATITNCILWANSPVDLLDSDDVLAPAFSFSDVQGGLPAGATGGGGIINADPMFIRNPDAGLDGVWGTGDDDYGDLRLLPESPCINTGAPGFVSEPTLTDLDGHARVLCMRVDMGAYEFGIGDSDCDLVVTLTDFADWNGCMTGPDAQSISPSCEAFDFEFDGDVDLIDWAGFQSTFTKP